MAARSRRGLFVAVGVVVAAVVLLTSCSSNHPPVTPTTVTVPNGNHRTGNATNPAATTARPESVPPAGLLTGPFSVSGNKILDGNGQQYVARGLVLYCLAIPNVNCSQPNSSSPVTDAQKIQASASFWHANTIRFQVAQEGLFGGTGGTTNQVDARYLSQLDSEVALANRLGMVAIITLQEERYNGPPLPTATATAFWTTMAAHYKSSPLVMFDLYNEPRLVSQDIPASDLSTSSAFPTTVGSAQNMIWNLWKSGGSAAVTDGAGGPATTYSFVGMQQLVDDVRATGAANVVIAEGNHGDHDLSGVAGLSEATGGTRSYALSGSNVSYGIEPDLHAQALGPVPATASPAGWDAAWGNLAQSVPIVMAAFQDWSPGGFCYPQAPVVLPQLLAYLGQRKLGLIAWTLDPGILIQGTNLEDPTTFQGISAQPCGQAFDPNGRIGPGADILQFFGQYARS